MSISFFDVAANKPLLDMIKDDRNPIGKYSIYNRHGEEFKLVTVANIEEYKKDGTFIVPQSQTDYMEHKILDDSVVSIFYTFVTEQIDSQFAKYLVEANNHVRNNTVLNAGEEFDVVLKGGGACRWYYLKLLKALNIQRRPAPPLQMAAMQYKENISDIDVELYSKKLSSDKTNLLSVQICKWLMFNRLAAIKKHVNVILGQMNGDPNLLKAFQKSNLYPNVTGVNIMLPNEKIKDKLIQKHGKYVFNSAVDSIVTGDTIPYGGPGFPRDQITDCYISFTNEYELCTQTGDKFALARFNIRTAVELTFARGPKQTIYIKLSLYDIGMGLNCSNGYLPKMGVKNPVIKVANELSVFTLEYVVKDLYAMLYVSNIFIWNFVKYEKRIKRLIFNIVLLDLDQFSKKNVIDHIQMCITAFDNIITDVDKNTNTEAINNKITFLLVESQHYRHIGSKLYMLMDGLLLFYYLMLAKLGYTRTEDVKNFIDKYWGIEHCTSCNIIPIQSKVKYANNLTAADYDNANQFKKNMVVVLNEIIGCIGQLFP